MLSSISDPKTRRFLFVILGLALILRMAAVIVLDPPLISDDQDYEAIARHIVSGQGITLEGQATAYRPPGFPLFLAAIYAVAGQSFIAVRIVQALLDTLSCFLLFDIGRRLTSDRRALIAAGIMAVFPLQILYTTALMTESFFTFFLILSVRLLLTKNRSMPVWLATGGVIGCAVLIRTTALALPLLVIIAPVFRDASSNNRLRIVAALGIGLLIVLAPWIARNHETFGRWTLTSNGGVNFWIGNHHGANGSFHFPKGNELDLIADEFARNDAGIQRGLEFWRSEPLNALVVTGKKFAHFFEIDYWMIMLQHFRPEWRSLSSAADVFRQLPAFSILATHLPFVAVLLGALVMIFLSPPSVQREWSMVILLCAGWLVIHLIFFATARYRFPLHPFLILASVEGYPRLYNREYTRSRPRLAGLILMILVLLLGWSAEAWILLGGSVQSLP